MALVLWLRSQSDHEVRAWRQSRQLVAVT